MTARGGLLVSRNSRASDPRDKSKLIIRCGAAGGSGLFPGAVGKSVLLHEISAARAAGGIVPRLHGVLGLNRTSQFFGVIPDERREGFRRRVPGALTQNDGGDFGPVKPGEFDQVWRIRPPPLPDEHIVQFPAVPAEDRLDDAMQAAIGAARDPGTVLAVRTFKEIGFAHGLEIPRPGRKLNGKSAADRRRQSCNATA